MKTKEFSNCRFYRKAGLALVYAMGAFIVFLQLRSILAM